ncbi:hypothetical protein Q4577_09315 [Marinovum sp. 2_MG-2023]|uniref:hypothetical protein n=1 Tax=unclassified Marinovum TaxID=2647166 RepID=UPI0026E40236|nr:MULTISPECIES: hypothetical protein [unclassified Marinovum]MDO6730217.1 hypothetical protein [Marinovum sp. 2_MG-2023]MDO6778955.1 hypothetical protein [Marinovum sp. 1_MG-2023]
MKPISYSFLLVGTVAVILGMLWGIQMSATGDHTLAPAHAHLNLLGWVSMAIFAFYYQLVPGAEQGLLPKLHFAAAVVALGLLVPGIVLAIQGKGDMLAKLGSVVAAVSMLLFLFVLVRTGRKTA